jgi:hypothetical protein
VLAMLAVVIYFVVRVVLFGRMRTGELHRALDVGQFFGSTGVELATSCGFWLI